MKRNAHRLRSIATRGASLPNEASSDTGNSNSVVSAPGQYKIWANLVRGARVAGHTRSVNKSEYLTAP